MKTLYSLGIYIYGLAIRIAALFNPKAKKWMTGRKKWKNELTKIPDGTHVKWFHFASLGEFEQGRPLMEALKKKDPHFFLLITFFSPSGYEIRKNYELADLVSYLPLDSPSNAQFFLEKSKVKEAYFIKYEFWFNYLHELKTRNIPTYLVSGIFRREQHFFRWYGRWFRKQLQSFHFFFLQNQRSVDLLLSIGYGNCLLTGDSRFDRVKQIAEHPIDIPYLKKFSEKKPAFIIGSNWPKDDEILIPFIQKHSEEYRFVLAPHNIVEEQLRRFEEQLAIPSVRLSEAKDEVSDQANVLIVDAVGFLSSIYQYGKFAFIGGGFGSNVHNVLEAAVYGLPCFFGPNYHKFQECHDLIQRGSAFVVHNGNDLETQFLELQTTSNYEKAAKSALSYIQEQAGATAKMVNQLGKMS